MAVQYVAMGPGCVFFYTAWANNGHSREGRSATGSRTSGGLKALRLPDHFGAGRGNESNECAASIVLDRRHCGAGEDVDLCGARGGAP